MTTPLFMLRAFQLGLSVLDMNEVTIGLVFDMYIESGNDEYEYPDMATQEDFDSF